MSALRHGNRGLLPVLLALVLAVPSVQAGASLPVALGCVLARLPVGLQSLPPWAPGGGARGGSGRGSNPRDAGVRGQGDRPQGNPQQQQGSQLSTLPTGWDAWWDANRDEYLWTLGFPQPADETGESAPVQRRGEWPDTGWAPPEPVVTNAAGGLTGRGQQAPVDGNEPLQRLTRVEIVPTLRQVLEEAHEEPLTSTALLALCRAAGHEPDRELDRYVATRLADDVLPVQIAAAFGLGLRGTRDAVEPLLQLARDAPGGRAIVGGRLISWQIRLASALGLGFTDDRAAVAALREVWDKVGDTDEVLGPGVVTALGLMGPGVADRAAAPLLELVDDHGREPRLRAAAVLSLGRLGHRPARPLLIELLNDRDERTLVRQSTALALGRLVVPGDGDGLDALLTCVDTAKDESHRHFAWIALGHLGENDRNPASHPEAHEQIVSALRHELKTPRLGMDRPWAALAAGLYARARPSALGSLAVPLRDALEDVADPANRGAYVIALGLLRDTSVVPVLLHDFDEIHLPEFRGQVATALGLMEAREAAGHLRAEAAENDVPREVLKGIALGLRMMLDTEAVEALRADFAASGSTTERIQYAEALGILGHPAAVPDLAAFALDADQHPAARAAACEALARIAEGAAPPWSAHLTIDSNYVEGIGGMPDLFGAP